MKLLTRLSNTFKYSTGKKIIQHLNQKKMKKILICAAFAFITLNSCKKDVAFESKKDVAFESKRDVLSEAAGKANQGTKFNTFKGPEVEMGNGKARSWIKISHTGVPREIGVEITNEVLSGLPEANFSVDIPMHVKARETTPFDHLYITWSAHGHPLPGGAFIAPHFDVRFFMMSLEDQLAIPAPPAPSLFNLPPTGFMPANYFPDRPGPKVGMNWTDKSFSSSVPVTKTMILGSFDGKFTFEAPIIILPVLQSGESFSIPFAQQTYFAEHTWYPTKYNIYEDNDKHYVTLSDFVLR
jgi:hypothetical protein